MVNTPWPQPRRRAPAGIITTAAAAAVAAVLALPAAYAQTELVAETRARALFDEFAAGLRRQLQMQKLSGTVTDYTLSDGYAFSQLGDAYTATFDPLRLRFAEHMLNLAPLTLLAEPRDDDTAAIGLRLPERITARNDDGETATVTIGSQNAKGLWSDAIDKFTEFGMSLGDLRATFTAPQAPAVTLSAVDLDHRFSVDDDTRWQQRSEAELGALSIAASDGEMTVGGGRMLVTAGGDDFAALQQYGERMASLTDEISNAGGQLDLGRLLRQTLTGFGDMGGNGTIIMHQLAFAQNGQTLGGVERMRFDVSGGLRDDALDYGYAVEGTGMELPMIPLPPQFALRAARFGVAVEGLDVALLARIAELSAEIEAAGEDAGEQLMQRYGLELFEQFKNGSAAMILDNTYIDAGDAGMRLNGRLNAERSSPFGVTGEMTLQLYGIDELSAQMGLNANPGVGQALVMLGAFSQPVEVDGRTVNEIRMTLSPQGQVLVNGEDVTPMLMPGAAPQ